jgi:hypothetical protein
MKSEIIGWKEGMKKGYYSRCGLNDPAIAKFELKIYEIPYIMPIECKTFREAEILQDRCNLIFEAGRKAQRQALRDYLAKI